ncbi:MAG TPA: hypothetical protein VHG09_09210, partial [Longimicrobiales bacterium]|nr:hypothetical protein [Longimicrobiales bacterium]
PSAFISQNEIDAANTVRFDFMNAQEQRKFYWPASFALARAYLDQLERGNGLEADVIEAAREELERAERLSGLERGSALTQLATRLTTEAAGARDAAKVRKLATAVAELSTAN